MDNPAISYEYIADSSPVTWMGDDGLISNCEFLANTALNGGAVTW